jgi:hydrogenase nickel incorporation protein HypB
MFHKADAVLVNKTDLAEPSGKDLRELATNVKEVNPNAVIFEVSCKTGAGLDHWFAWLSDAIASRRVAIAART